MAGSKFNILYSKIKLEIPLSQVRYDSKGIKFKLIETWLEVPYDQQPLKFKFGHLLEEFKEHLSGKITVIIHFHRIHQKIEKIEVIEDEDISKEIANITSRIEQVKSDIKSLANEGALTIDRAQTVLAENGFEFNTDKIQRILIEIISNMSIKQIQKLEIPLSDLIYDSDGIKFSWQGFSFQVNKDILPFKTSPILEEIKNQFEGNFIIFIESYCLGAWDKKDTKLLVGRITANVKKIKIDQNTLNAFKELRGSIICKNIGKIVISTDEIESTLTEVEFILNEWGLDLKDKEIGEKIISLNPYWTIKQEFQIPLKNVKYSTFRIDIFTDCEESISADILPFKTSDVLEKIKDILKGEMKVIRSKKVVFKWDEIRQQLIIGPEDITYEVEIKDKFLEQIKYIHVEYDAIIDGHPDDWEVIIREGVRHTDTISKDIKKYYDPECIRFLEEIIEKLKGQIYMTSIDLWFRIGDILIWERPESKPQKTNEEAKKSHATYIFKWPEPEQPLDIFIAIIWSYKFDYNRKKYSKTGCIKTINHTYEDKLKGWKSKLIDIILKKSNTKGNIKSLIDEIHT